MHIHAKDSRFNFRKDEFAWRGELDFLRAKSVPLILWGLVLICAMTILWSTKSLVLEKENSFTAKKLEAVCSDILEQKNLSARKCLTLIQEQISAGVDLGIPDITASGIYLEASKNIPQDLNVIISELDIQEKRLRISAETDSFEDVDKIVASLTKVPCLTNLEKGRAQQMEKKVKFNLTSDVDCSNNKDAPKVR